ncbi:MAG: SDR family oxidoreductase [Proteobacteria bacterium]|nr:SDR family oxidoreductase [Pseudomonadota bacterium]
MSVERLAGKRCLVTAAGQGIGRAIALGFTAEGADVLATDIDGGALAALGEVRDDIETAVMDATDAERVAAVCNSRTFDAVANVVGYVHQGSILDCTRDDWERTFRVNVDSAYLVCRAVLPAMLANGGGSIIHLSSVASSIKGVPARFAYGAAKGAVIGLSKAIAADFVGQGVRCNAICPGTVDTPSLAERVAELGGDAEEVWRSFRARQPMGRLGRAEEVAHLAVYLASDESAFTTGCEFVIDGGWSI